MRLCFALKKMNTMPNAHVGPELSMGRNRLRSAASRNEIGPPPSLSTRMWTTRLPGVCPFHSHSNTAKYAHSVAK